MRCFTKMCFFIKQKFGSVTFLGGPVTFKIYWPNGYNSLMSRPGIHGWFSPWEYFTVHWLRKCWFAPWAEHVMGRNIRHPSDTLSLPMLLLCSIFIPITHRYWVIIWIIVDLAHAPCNTISQNSSWLSTLIKCMKFLQPTGIFLLAPEGTVWSKHTEDWSYVHYI